MRNPYENPPAPPCPQCGKPDAARVGSTAWGHDHYCCSNACGFAFADSVERWDREVQTARLDAAKARANLQRMLEERDRAARRLT